MSSLLEFGKDPGGVFGARSGRKASEAQERATKLSTAELRRQFDITEGRTLEAQEFQRAQLAPFIKAGGRAFEQQQALIGLGGEEAQQDVFAGLAESPGQQFLRNRQERALVRNAAATGGRLGGNVKTALQQQAVGFAQQDLENQFNRLGAISGGGLSAATGVGQGALTVANQLGQFGQRTTEGIVQQNTAAANARASGIQAQQQATSNKVGAGLGIAAAFLSDERLKTNIKKTGKLDNGLNWYTWDWTEEGAALSNGQRSEGVIAQEAQALYPHAVTEINGYLTVNYGSLH